MNDSTNSARAERLHTLMSHIQDGCISITDLFPDRRLYKVLAVFADDAGTMFMMVGEHRNSFALFEASQFNDWSFHSAHSSVEGALNEIRDFRLKRIS